MSRTRLVRPGFFSDERLARLPAWTRLVYVGLWTLADDGGYFDRKPGEIAAELFRFDTVRRRERRVDTALDELLDAGRIRWLDCGEHGVIPTLPEHGVIRGGNHAYNVRARHDEVCVPTLFRAREAPMTNKYVPSTNGSLSESVSESVSGSVSESVRGARSDFEKKVPRTAALGSRR